MNDTFFFDLFSTPGRMICFLIGVAGATFALWLDARNRECKINFQPVGICAGVGIMVFVLNTCLTLVYELKEQSRLGRLSDEFSLEVSEASVKRDKELTYPPAEVADLPITNPKRQVWYHQVLKEYFDTVGPLNEKRAEVIRQRHEIPLPK